MLTLKPFNKLQIRLESNPFTLFSRPMYYSQRATFFPLLPSLKIFYLIFVFSRMSEEVFEASPSITKRKWRRVHGLQWPWHPQQVVAWLILIYFTLFTFCVVIPSFNRNAAIVLTGQYFQTSFHSRIQNSKS